MTVTDEQIEKEFNALCHNQALVEMSFKTETNSEDTDEEAYLESAIIIADVFMSNMEQQK